MIIDSTLAGRKHRATMAGQSSNLRASSSRRSRSMEEIERQLDDATKRQRSSQPDATVTHPNGAAAVPVVPLHYAAGGQAMTVAFPMAGVNGAALRWSTAATLGAAAQAAAAIPLPPIAGVNGSAAVPFVVGPALIGSPGPAPPAVGLPLAVALDRIKDNALRVMLSALMLSCNPPVGQRQGWTGAPPPWWPTAAEDWWAPEVVAHLNTMREHTPVPFAPAYKLKKVQKVAVLVAVVKHLSPDFDGIFKKVVVSLNGRAKLTDEEKDMWKSALENEAARHKSGSVPMVPMFNFVLQQQAPPPPPPHGDGYCLTPIGAATTENIVRGGGVGVAAADGCEQQVVVNLDGASVTAPGQAIAAAEPEQHGIGALRGGSMAADGGSEKPVDIPVRDDRALLLSNHVHQVAAANPEQQGLINTADATAADMDQLLNDMLAPYQTPQVAVEKAPETRPWYMEEDMSSFFDDFELPGVTPNQYFY